VKNEPVFVICGAAASFITAVIALLVAFGVHVSTGQGAAILGVTGVVVNVVTALAARSKVTPTAKVRSLKVAKPRVRKQAGHGDLTTILLVLLILLVVAVLLGWLPR
jgi:hypothetical protein